MASELFRSWLAEILSDFWSVARVGVSSTLGLMGVVSLPRAFVFRLSLDDPHPFPWIRVKLSCAMGNALYPDPQWGRLAAIWEAVYPSASLDPRRRLLITALEASIPGFLELLVNARPPSLRGTRLADAIGIDERQPARLRALHDTWRRSRGDIRGAPPSLVAATMGQARADGKITPETESHLLSALLRQWALASTLNGWALCG